MSVSDRGVGRGHWAMTLPWVPKAPFAIVRRPPIANVFTGKMGRPSSDEKSLRNVPPCVYKENVVEGCPSNDEKSLRKVPPMTSVRRLPWVKWRPPSPCHPLFAIF